MAEAGTRCRKLGLGSSVAAPGLRWRALSRALLIGFWRKSSAMGEVMSFRWEWSRLRRRMYKGTLAANCFRASSLSLISRAQTAWPRKSSHLCRSILSCSTLTPRCPPSTKGPRSSTSTSTKLSDCLVFSCWAATPKRSTIWSDVNLRSRVSGSHKSKIKSSKPPTPRTSFPNSTNTTCCLEKI